MKITGAAAEPKPSLRRAVFTEAALLAIVFIHFFPGSLAFLIKQAPRGWPAIPAAGIYIAARVLAIRRPARWQGIVYFLAVLLLQALISRLAFAVSWRAWLLMLALAVVHNWVRRKSPENKWALVSMLAAPLFLLPFGLVCARAFLIALAVIAVVLPLILAADARRLSWAATGVFTFAFGWQILFAGFYYRDPADACARLAGPVRANYLPATLPPQALSFGLTHGFVNLVSPGCAPGDYLIASRKDGLFLLRDGILKPLRPREQVFGFVNRCAQGKALGVTWEGRGLLSLDLAAGQVVSQTTYSEDRPLDGLVQAGDELAAVTDTGSDILLFSDDGLTLKRSLPETGAREIDYDAAADRLLTVFNWKVRIVGPKTGEIVHRKFLYSWEIRLAQDAAHRRLFAMSFFTGALFELDLDTLAIRKVLRVPLGSRYILYHPAENALYLSDFIGGRLIKLDADSLETRWTKSVGPMPRRLRPDTDGSVLIGAGCGAVRMPP